MNRSPLSSPAQARTIACDVAAHASVRVPLEAVAELRRKPGPVYGEPLPLSFLKHADEQTVVGLAAVYQAIHDHQLAQPGGPSPFTNWGVVAAPRFLGRPTMAGALQRFAAEGAWGVSPHLIPHRSLHAVSGTVSQALKIHGPNFGAGGGPGAAAEALLVSLAMLDRKSLPGVWVVLTALDPEPIMDEACKAPPATCCVGLALALVPCCPSCPGIRLHLLGADAQPPKDLPGLARFDIFRLQALLKVLAEPRVGPSSLVQVLDDGQGPGSRLEISRGSGRGIDREQKGGSKEQAGAHASPSALLPVPSCGEAQR